MSQENTAEENLELDQVVQGTLCYDLVVVGTGLVESMVATAATKRGLKVLQVDSNDYYGGDFSSSNLSGLLNILNSQQPKETNSEEKLWSRYPIFYDVFHNEITRDCASFLAPSYKLKSIIHPSLLNQDKARMQDIPNMDVHSVSPVYWSFLTKKDQLFTAAAAKDREFAIDCAQKLIVGTGKYIDCLVQSGVSKYLEFKSTDALYFFVDKNHGKDKKYMWKVPCSKNDIFNSKQLTALEKRSLMKFHQFVADWGRTKVGKDVKVLNEKELALGRSLYRPQNKSDNLDQIDTNDLSNKTFDDILKQFGLSPKLKSLILYGLCLYNGDTNNWSAEFGLTELSLHINSLGKYGETAFLNTLYGISDMAQGFCRMSAVWGASYMLRKRILEINRTTEESNGSSLLTLIDDENNSIQCKNIVINSAFRPQSICKPLFTSQSVLIYYGQIFPDAKCISMIPPNYEYTDNQNNAIRLDNKYPICITQSDNSSCCAPEEYSVVHVSTLIEDKVYAEDNRSLETFLDRASAVSSECNDLHLRIQKLLEDLSAESPANVFRSTIVKPIFEDTPSDDPNLIFSKGWNDASMNLEGEVDEARSILSRLFGFEELFEETADEDADTGNYEEEEIDEYEAVYKFAANLNT